MSGKTALVTGASSGIGWELARRLAARGVRVGIAARRQERLEEFAEEVVRKRGEKPVVLPTDLSVRGAAKELAAQAVRMLEKVDIVVNNAGGGVGGLQWVVGDRDEGRETFELNFWSPLALIQELVPPMRERGNGAVVNVTSIAQVLALGGLGHYNSSKAALAMATETLRLELYGTGVHVLEVIAGPVATGMQGEARLVPGAEEVLKRAPLGNPQTLAKLTVRALEKGRKRLVYPRALAGAYNFPFAGRAYVARGSARFAKRMSEADRELLSSVVRGGSSGDPMAQAARETWERRDRSKPG
ncbi:MAG TPA: SDR family NAD(P)-dependent oxidoreductase [Actinomycetota bacterium]|nr:SDR family NAD(P)-dependent oxidoreductase [Actinomycetota bacterium]